MIRSYVSVLKEYRTNTLFTNHCAVKMLHRISYDQGDMPLIFQLSLFRVFQKILNDPVSSLGQYKASVNGVLTRPILCWFPAGSLHQ